MYSSHVAPLYINACVPPQIRCALISSARPSGAVASIKTVSCVVPIARCLLPARAPVAFSLSFQVPSVLCSPCLRLVFIPRVMSAKTMHLPSNPSQSPPESPVANLMASHTVAANNATATTTAVVSRTSFLIEDILHQHNQQQHQHHQQYANYHQSHHNDNINLSASKTLNAGDGVEFRGTFNSSILSRSPSDESSSIVSVNGANNTAPTSPQAALNKSQTDYRKHGGSHHNHHPQHHQHQHHSSQNHNQSER